MTWSIPLTGVVGEQEEGGTLTAIAAAAVYRDCFLLVLSPALGSLISSALRWLLELLSPRALQSPSTSRSYRRQVKKRAAWVTPAVAAHIAAWTTYACQCIAFLLLAYSVVLAFWEVAEEVLWETAPSVGIAVALGVTISFVVGNILGYYMVWRLETIEEPRTEEMAAGDDKDDKENTPQKTKKQSKDGGTVMALVMFFHALMEGCMLGAMMRREHAAFRAIIDSVLYHNIAEGFVIAVRCGDSSSSEGDDVAVGDGPVSTPVFLSQARHASFQPQTESAAASAQLRLAIRSLLFASLSHVGQAVALAAFVFFSHHSNSNSSHRTTSDYSTAAGTSNNVASSLFLGLLNGGSLGSMLATLWYELIPEVMRPPTTPSSWWGKRSKGE